MAKGDIEVTIATPAWASTLALILSLLSAVASALVATPGVLTAGSTAQRVVAGVAAAAGVALAALGRSARRRDPAAKAGP